MGGIALEMRYNFQVKRYRSTNLSYVEMDARDLARIHIKKYPFCTEFNEPKYIVSQSFADLFTDFTPIILFNNYWRQEWMDAVAWHNFLKYKNDHD